ncbi:hypothetical protein CF8_3447 [Nocardioides sp. CF8]|uniref:hypothetical protein n=1 Tax=Nocardioides sp. CF8 TaxID=110319 RepID=UPI0003312632|nr:hypothetical protein [Nocardioides sp. CF8]EON22673.1 hypothetical protein CF8_3447 [Nocardioides sp. CF8]
MSIDETLTQGAQREDHEDQALTRGIVASALGLTALMGGGILANAFQYWTIDIVNQGNPSGANLVHALAAVPAIVLGIVAVAVGLSAARSIHTLASATGKAGAITGILAIVGGALWAVAILKSDLYS